MPLEIRELVIRTTITNDSSRLGEAANDTLSDASQAAIVATCIDQVLAILQSRSER